MSLIGPYTVVNDPTTHDPLGYKIVTGLFDFCDDRLPGGKKWWMAVKLSPNAHGSIVADPGVITGFTVTNGGSGYTSAPTVVFAGGGGTGAAATAVVSSAGVVTGITLTSAGSGYISAPTLSFSGGGGTGLTATLQFTAGKAHVDASKALAFPGVKAVYWYEHFSNFSQSWLNYGVMIAGVVAEDLRPLIEVVDGVSYGAVGDAALPEGDIAVNDSDGFDPLPNVLEFLVREWPIGFEFDEADTSALFAQVVHSYA
jgi:hypothetical protein